MPRSFRLMPTFNGFLFAFAVFASILVASEAMEPFSSLRLGVTGYSTNDFDQIASTGLKWVRMDFPNATKFQLARQKGLEILPITSYGFQDLAPPNSTDWKTPPLPKNYLTWTNRNLDRWRNMTEPPKAIEVWNEPYQNGFWPPMANATAYLELFKVFAKEAWKIWPNMTLLVASDTIGSSDGWRKSLLAADTTGFLNDVRIRPTVHPYIQARTPKQVTSSPCSWDLNRFECTYSDFVKHGHPNPKIWATEFGWESNTPTPGYALYGAVTEELQANYTIQALELFRNSTHVEAAFSYFFQNGNNWNYNWIRPNGTEKPVVQWVRNYISANTPSTSSAGASTSNSTSTSTVNTHDNFGTFPKLQNNGGSLMVNVFLVLAVLSFFHL